MTGSFTYVKMRGYYSRLPSDSQLFCYKLNTHHVFLMEIIELGEGEFSWTNFGPADSHSGPEAAVDPGAIAAYASQHPRSSISPVAFQTTLLLREQQQPNTGWTPTTTCLIAS
jgi:hypothetical protein